MKKFGFTLAEVLITLGIIGVVAAVTLPTVVMNAKYKQIGVKLQKFHTNLENAARSYVAENEDFNTKNDASSINQRRTQLRNFFNENFEYKQTRSSGNNVTTDNRVSLNCADAGGDFEEDDGRYHQMYKGLTNTPYSATLKDDTIIFATDRKGSKYMDTDRYSTEKYGSPASVVNFDPNVKGLPQDAKKLYSFTITSKGFVFPNKNSACTMSAYSHDWKLNPADYKSGGVCYKTPTTPTPRSEY